MESLKPAQNKLTRLIIVGAGGHGKELASYVGNLGAGGEKVELLGFIDEGKPAGSFAESRILGKFEALRELVSLEKSSLYYLTATGDNTLRQDFVKKIEALGYQDLKPWILYHPQATVGKRIEIGEGSCLCPGSVLTTDIQIGRHCIVNVNVSISHDVRVGDFTNLNPGVKICGNVTLGEACYIGAGATVIDKIKIGKGVIIGAGAVVTKDLPDYVTAVGVPAKVIKRHFVNVPS